MKVLLDEPRVFVTYGSASLYSGEDRFGGDTGKAWRDHSNGLAGAGRKGRMHLTVGTHTGWVPFRVELHDAEPALDDSWGEIVEVSFTAARKKVYLQGLDGDRHRLELPRDDYRVRYHARNFDREKEDSYLLQLWPAAPERGRIVKQTSEEAAYWHRARRPLTAAERAEDERQEAAERERQARERWGDREPGERLRNAEGLHLPAISRLDIDLEFAVAGLPDDAHRRIASWVTLRCLERAGLIGVPKLAPAVAALRRGERVPVPFDDSGHVWAVLRHLAVPRTEVPAPPDGEYDQSPQDWAASAIFHSALDDSLAAVLEVLVCIAYVHGQHGYREAFAGVRAAFPELSAALS
ncbi:hypothetical protein [Actinoplanes sp. NPDC023714]|uniref:hypothetical protein n=1 Tax=Actinoplanes sp. NPDC023714 TaxID=3154322 RepID=UPI0034091FD2